MRIKIGEIVQYKHGKSKYEVISFAVYRRDLVTLKDIDTYRWVYGVEMDRLKLVKAREVVDLYAV